MKVARNKIELIKHNGEETMKVKELMPKQDSKILVRAVSLYVGQGDSTLFFIKDGNRYATMLVDINLDKDNGGINVPELVQKVLGKGEKLDVFLNTHPHKDHLRGIKELDDAVGFKKVMHADYDPGKDANDYWKAFDKIVERMKKSDPKSVVEIDGSYSENKFFDAKIHILAPAEYVTDETSEETAKKRRELIHENCVVFKIGRDDSWILQPGDADYDAFKKHIYEAHKDDLKSDILLAAHHGSRHFFKKDKEDEEAWTEPLEAIDPDCVVISAPKQSESPHGHPHKDAVKEYAKQCGAGNVFHVGKDHHSFVIDVFTDGQVGAVVDDGGELEDECGFESKTEAQKAPFVRTTDGEETPRQGRFA